MSITASMRALQSTIDSFKQQRNNALESTIYSESAKKQWVTEIEQKSAQTAEKQTKRLWGEIVATDDESVFQLNPSGLVWTEIEQSQTKVRRLKETASTSGISPTNIHLLEPRAKAYIARHTHAPDFAKGLEHVDEITRLGILEYGIGLLMNKRGLDWDRVFRQLEEMRDERFNPPVVQRAIESSDSVIMQAVEAHGITEIACNLFASQSSYLSVCLKGIFTKQHYAPNSRTVIPDIQVEIKNVPFGLTVRTV